MSAPRISSNSRCAPPGVPLVGANCGHLSGGSERRSAERQEAVDLRESLTLPSRRRIAVFTGKRGGFGAMLRIMRLIMDDPAMELRVIASDMHLNPTFGQTISEVRSQVAVDAVVDLSSYGDTPLDRAQALGRCVERLAPVLSEVRPDILLLLGDRGETLAAA